MHLNLLVTQQFRALMKANLNLRNPRSPQFIPGFGDLDQLDLQEQEFLQQLVEDFDYFHLRFQAQEQSEVFLSFQIQVLGSNYQHFVPLVVLGH